jgi:hypothetical protein
MPNDAAKDHFICSMFVAIFGGSGAAYGAQFAHKTLSNPDFPGSNLTMREDLGTKSFQQALIPNGLKIICKVSREIYTSLVEGVGGTRGGV